MNRDEDLATLCLSSLLFKMKGGGHQVGGDREPTKPKQLQTDNNKRNRNITLSSDFSSAALLESNGIMHMEFQ